MIPGHQEFFFSSNLVGKIFFSLLIALQDILFSLLISLQDFFPSKKGHVFTYTKNVLNTFCICKHMTLLHLHCGHCSNSSNMELQSFKML